MPRGLVTLVVALSALGLTACGGGGGGGKTSSSDTGAAVFEDAGCGGCHTLGAAGSTGTAGPDLDMIRPGAQLVVDQVTNGGGAMPAFGRRLTRAEIEAVAQYVADATGGGSGITAQGSNFTPDSTALSDCAKDDSACFRQAFGNLAYREGPKVALARFAADIQTNPMIERTCHPIAHTIGAGALKHYKGDVGRAFADGQATCGSGYYHGLLEWKLAGLSKDRVVSVARNVCTNQKIRTSNFVYYQCVHGLGHGLMLYTRYDLPEALDLCHGLHTSFDRVSCTGGVFMENQQSSYGIRSKYLKDDNLLYPCDSDLVVGTDKLYCYLLVTSYILPQVGADWSKVAAWCRKSDKDYVRICFQSMGRDASGSSRQEPSGIIEKCAKARPDNEADCLFGAARDILNNDSSDLRGRKLCERVQHSYQSYCFYGLGSILGSVYATTPERKAACARFAPPAYRPDCMRAARSVT